MFIHSQDIEQKPISIKGRVSIANLRKMTFYNTNLDLVYDNVYRKFGWILSIHSQDIEKNHFWHQSRAVTLLQICKKWPFTIQT